LNACHSDQGFLNQNMSDQEAMKPNRQLTDCKACGKEIAISASKCPHCGAARTNAMRLLVLAILATIIGLFLMRGILMG